MPRGGGGGSVRPAFQPHFVCIYASAYLCVFPHVPVCICACPVCGMHSAEFVHLVACVRVRGDHGGPPNREHCISKRCQNEFVTESVNLRRKGTAERERLSPGTQSLSD